MHSVLGYPSWKCQWNRSIEADFHRSPRNSRSFDIFDSWSLIPHKSLEQDYDGDSWVFNWTGIRVVISHVSDISCSSITVHMALTIITSDLLNQLSIHSNIAMMACFSRAMELHYTVKHLIFARTKFRECRIRAIREHLIFANRGGSKLSKTFYGLKIGPFLRIL